MDQEKLIRAVRAALAETPTDELAPEVLAAAQRLSTDADVTADEADELLGVLMTDQELGDAIDFHLREDGYRGPAVRNLDGSPVAAIWWYCPEPGCRRDPEPGDGQGPYRHSHCPDDGVLLVRR